MNYVTTVLIFSGCIVALALVLFLLIWQGVGYLTSHVKE